MLHAAVQEERQRAKEKSENEVESTSCASEDMPVEKILEAEQAVEPKTETYIETNLSVPSNSVSDWAQSVATITPALLVPLSILVWLGYQTIVSLSCELANAPLPGFKDANEFCV